MRDRDLLLQSLVEKHEICSFAQCDTNKRSDLLNAEGVVKLTESMLKKLEAKVYHTAESLAGAAYIGIVRVLLRH